MENTSLLTKEEINSMTKEEIFDHNFNMVAKLRMYVEKGIIRETTRKNSRVAGWECFKDGDIKKLRKQYIKLMKKYEGWQKKFFGK